MDEQSGKDGDKPPRTGKSLPPVIETPCASARVKAASRKPVLKLTATQKRRALKPRKTQGKIQVKPGHEPGQA